MVLMVFRNDYAVRMLEANVEAGIEAPLARFPLREHGGHLRREARAQRRDECQRLGRQDLALGRAHPGGDFERTSIGFCHLSSAHVTRLRDGGRQSMLTRNVIYTIEI